MAQSSTEICNRALVRIGSGTISSLDDDTDKATICKTVYAGIRDALLARHPWRFATAKVQLGRLTTAPINEWDYAYQLPTDLIAGPFAVFQSSSVGSRPMQDWEIFEDKLYTDQQSIWIDYRFRVAEAKMPEWFVELLVHAVAAAICKPITDQTEMTQYMQEIAFGTPSEAGRGGLFATAAIINAQANPPPIIEDFSLVDARFS